MKFIFSPLRRLGGKDSSDKREERDSGGVVVLDSKPSSLRSKSSRLGDSRARLVSFSVASSSRSSLSSDASEEDRMARREFQESQQGGGKRVSFGEVTKKDFDAERGLGEEKEEGEDAMGRAGRDLRRLQRRWALETLEEASLDGDRDPDAQSYA